MTVPFIPCQDFMLSIRFYEAMGFIIHPRKAGETTTQHISYEDNHMILQDAYVKEWAENTMLMIRVTDLETFIKRLEGVLKETFLQAKFSGPQINPWGKQIFLIDPTGVLIHVFQRT